MRTERLEARLTRKQKNLLEDAAGLRGETVSQFVVAAAEARARETLLDDQLTALTSADRIALVDALANPSPPSARLKAAWRRYKADSDD